MTSRPLRCVTRTQGNNAALKQGDVAVEGFRLEFEEVPVLVDAFRRMVRAMEYDVCEMAVTTYLTAREHGKRFTALPIFLVRGFHDGAIVHNARSPITDPRQLEGRSVGVNRGYTVTTGVWARGILQQEWAVDLDKVRWVLSGDEHVSEYQAPPNVERLEPGQTLEEMLVSGELAATVGVHTEHVDLEPLLPNANAAGLERMQHTGIFPINHLIVVKDELLQRHPHLASAIFEAFAEAKRRYVEALRKDDVIPASEPDRIYKQVMERTGTDPLPYGLAANVPTLERLIEHAVDQHILTRRVTLDSLFAEATLDLAG